MHVSPASCQSTQSNPPRWSRPAWRPRRRYCGRSMLRHDLGPMRHWLVRHRRDLAGVSIILALALAFLSPALKDGGSFGGFDLDTTLTSLGAGLYSGIHNYTNSDAVSQMVSWNALDWRLIHSGHFPLWNDYSGLGMPEFLNFESSTLSLPDLVSYAFPLRFAFLVVVFVKLADRGNGHLRVVQDPPAPGSRRHVRRDQFHARWCVLELGHLAAQRCCGLDRLDLCLRDPRLPLAREAALRRRIGRRRRVLDLRRLSRGERHGCAPSRCPPRRPRCGVLGSGKAPLVGRGRTSHLRRRIGWTARDATVVSGTAGHRRLSPGDGAQVRRPATSKLAARHLKQLSRPPLLGRHGLRTVEVELLRVGVLRGRRGDRPRRRGACRARSVAQWWLGWPSRSSSPSSPRTSRSPSTPSRASCG